MSNTLTIQTTTNTEVSHHDIACSLTMHHSYDDIIDFIATIDEQVSDIDFTKMLIMKLIDITANEFPKKSEEHERWIDLKSEIERATDETF